MRKNYITTYAKALEQMPTVFTSYDFGAKCRSMGVPSSHTVWAISRFLERRVGRVSLMTWDKRVNPYDSIYDPHQEYLTSTCDYSGSFAEALEKMPNEFGSREFVRKCVQLGVPKKVITNTSKSSDFLKEHTDRKGYRSWKKRMAHDGKQPVVKTNTEKMDVDSCIEFLKSKGFRIMKPVSEWVEL